MSHSGELNLFYPPSATTLRQVCLPHACPLLSCHIWTGPVRTVQELREDYLQTGKVQIFAGGEDMGQPRLWHLGQPMLSSQPAIPSQPAAQQCCYLTPLSQCDSSHPSLSSSIRALGSMSIPLSTCRSGTGEQIEGRGKHSAGRDQKR